MGEFQYGELQFAIGRRGDVGRHAGQTGEDRSGSQQIAGGGTAVLTDPRGVIGTDARLTGGLGMTSAFGGVIGTRHRTPCELPAIGTPEHTALMSGSLYLSEIAAGQDRTPLVGFAPIVLDPAGPTEADLADVPGATDGAEATEPSEAADVRPVDGLARTATLPSRRSLRTPRPVTVEPKGVPTPRSGIRLAGLVGSRPLPPLVTGTRTGGLCAEDLRASLAALPLLPVQDDPTPTGELARPFVNETSLADWVTAGDVPPPVSVDVFQRAVRAGLDLEDAAAVLAAGPHARPEIPAEPEPAVEAPVPAIDDVPAAVVAEPQPPESARLRTRRELRARERALGSIRGVTARRLAKGGVLAITALGVVSSANPQTLEALGLEGDDLAASRSALGFAGAVAPKLTPPALSPEAAAERQQLRLERSLRHELNDAAADEATRAGTTAGDALLDLAFQQDRILEIRRRAEYARAVREVARDPRGYAALLVQDRGWDAGQFRCLERLWHKESNWNYRATNRSSGAYGIAQALPGSKMASAGSDWRTNPMTQIKWGLNYIEDRYGSPCQAWAHSQSTGWY